MLRQNQGGEKMNKVLEQLAETATVTQVGAEAAAPAAWRVEKGTDQHDC